MKVQQTFNKSQNKLLAFKLIKTKIYKTSSTNFIKVEDVILRLKKALHIIFKFHSKKKRILFIGNAMHTSIQIQKLFKTTKHIFIPEAAWVNGLIKNRSYSTEHEDQFYGTVTKKIATLVEQTQKHIDLIVLLDSKLNVNALNEGHIARFPIIALNCDLDITNSKPSYKIPGNFFFTSKKIKNKLFYLLLATVFKKIARVSKVYAYIDRNFLSRGPDKYSWLRKPFSLTPSRW